jgi:hypothetical protein
LLTNLGRLPGDEYTGESRLPGSEYTGESITNLNNSSNIRTNSKSFLGVSNGTKRRCLMKKNRVKKSRDTVPLKLPLVPLARIVLLFSLCFRKNSYDFISKNRRSWQERGFKTEAVGYSMDSKFG